MCTVYFGQLYSFLKKNTLENNNIVNIAIFFRSSFFLQFFSPLVPVRIEFEFNPMDGRPTGEANVDFSTHQEAVEGMKKHKTNMRKWLFLTRILHSLYLSFFLSILSRSNFDHHLRSHACL